MVSPIKVFILGSCASRDPFEIADPRDFDIVGYYARSSLASLGAEPYLDEKILLEVKSNWQQRMVRADMEKSVFSELVKTDFDVLLVDLIDERFALSVNGSSVHTISTEYKKALYKPNPYAFVSTLSKEKIRLWQIGLNKVSQYLLERRLDNKLVVNKFYWSMRCRNPEKLFARYSEDQIQAANEQLEWMYEEISKALPKAKFIAYSDEDLETDEQHKWGLDPFHYGESAFRKQLTSVYGLSIDKIKFNIKHSLGTKKFSFPINWKADPFKSRSWMHHFVSLRWLTGKYSHLFVRSVLTSFYEFHCEKKIKNPYYNEIRGDHAAAIRLGVLIGLDKEWDMHQDPAWQNVTHELIFQEIKNLQSMKMYREGHNHGLMVDLALLGLVLACPAYKQRVDLGLVLERSAKTLGNLWHSSGLTKEHSVSYQEYNMPLALEYFTLLEKLGLEPETSVDLEDVLEESKKFLGFALRSNGEYFPLGDSFRLPNEKILNKIFGKIGSESARSLLLPYSAEEGAYCNDNFFIYRKSINGRQIHFAATCCWDSHVHKQNDELSFCLEVDGVAIFDDPGYTEYLPWEGIRKLQSEVSHSTVTVVGIQWGDVKFPNGGSKILSFSDDLNGFSLSMSMQRCGEIKVVRKISFSDDILSIIDLAIGQELSGQKFIRRLLFGPKVSVSRVKGSPCFGVANLKSQRIAEIHVDGEVSIELADAQFVLADRKLVMNSPAMLVESGFYDGSYDEKNSTLCLPGLQVKLVTVPVDKAQVEFDDTCFSNDFYYEINRPKDVDELIRLSKGFVSSELISEERRAAAGVVGVYKSIEFGRNAELKYFHQCLHDMLPSIFGAAVKSKRLKGVRDDPKQVAISVSTALWHAQIMLGVDPVHGLTRLRDEVSCWDHLEVPYSQNVARSITLLSYVHFARGELKESLRNIEWMAGFISRINVEVGGFENVNSSYAGDYHKAIGLLQLCIAGKEWICNHRKREKYWSPKAMLGLCPRVRKGVSSEFDREFIGLLGKG